MMKLEECTLADPVSVWEMLQDLPGENGFENGGYGIPKEEFPSFLRHRVDWVTGKGLDPKYVPMTTYWLFKDGYPVGMSKLRHYLNDALLQGGGHIGYGIRPGERGKGYGNSILKLTLDKAREMNLEKVLLTCSTENVPSRRVIENNGGVLDKTCEDKCHYWITL